MASSGPASSIARRRILANAQNRKSGGTSEAPAEEDAEVAARNAEAERILSKRVKVRSNKTRRKKPRGKSTTQVVLLAIIGIAGIAAIIGLRYLSEALGVNWIGE